jgi:uncharacterized membrane protein YbhN (UPF0104 family)
MLFVLSSFWNWIEGVFGRIGDLSVYWLLLALALKTAESAFIALGWRNILRAAYPDADLSFKTAWGASQGGTAINAVAPAQSGTAAMIGIFRSRIPGSSVAGVTSATVVQSLFFVGVSVLLVIVVAFLRPHTVSKGSPSDESTGFFASHPILIPIIVLAVAVLLYLLWPRLKPWLLKEWHKARAGAAIVRDWRRYASEVALPQAASYGCRVGVNVVFMAAFAIPVTVYTVFLVAASHTLSQLFAITPGGVGQTQALDVATLRRYSSGSNVTAFSVTQDAVVTIWNVVLGVAVLLWAFGPTQAKQLLLRSRKHTRERSPAAPTAPGEP